ncbi:unnamed protein product, partial [Effrenium voratum]
EARRRIVSLPKRAASGVGRNQLFDDSDLSDAITLGSPTSPMFAISAPEPFFGGEPPREAPEPFFGGGGSPPQEEAEVFDGFVEAEESPQHARQAASKQAAKASRREETFSRMVAEAKGKPAVPKIKLAKAKSVPDAKAQGLRARPGSLSDSIRAKAAQAKARAASSPAGGA